MKRPRRQFLHLAAGAVGANGATSQRQGGVKPIRASGVIIGEFSATSAPDSCMAAKLSIIRSDNRGQVIRSTSVVGPGPKTLSGLAMSARLQVIAPTGWCAGGGPPKWLAAGLCDH